MRQFVFVYVVKKTECDHVWVWACEDEGGDGGNAGDWGDEDGGL
jgi:hypothetical protein